MSIISSPVLVALSVLVAVIASYVALSVAGRLVETRGKARVEWLVGGSIVMGLGLWSMHLVGSLAVHHPANMAYDLRLWLLAALLAVLTSALGLFVASRPHLRRRDLAFASLVLGTAMAGMHYLGVAALEVYEAVVYPPIPLAVSVAVACVVALLVLVLARRVTFEEQPGGTRRRFASAVTMGASLAAVHYIASLAVPVLPQSNSFRDSANRLVTGSGLATLLVIAAAVLLGLTLTAVIVDREMERRSAQAEENRRLYEAAERARAEARERATIAEELTTELRSQAADLESQAVELEAVNHEIEATSARLRSVVDSALDAIITINEDGYVIDWNQRAEQMFGWSGAEAVGRLLEDLIIPPVYKEAHRRGLERYVKTGEGRIINRRIEVRGQRRDGSELPVELTIAPARAGSRQIFSSFIRDLTRERLAERRVVAEHEVVRVLAESHSREEAAPRVLEAVGTALGWEVGVFWGVDPGGHILQFVDQWQSPTFPGRFDMASPGLYFKRGEGLPGRVWASKAAEWVGDIVADSQFHRAEAAERAGLKSAVAFPIIHAGECLGVIEFFNEDVVEPEPELMEMIAAIGIGIGQAMRRIEAEEERDHAMHRMEEANVELARRSVEANRARAVADEANRAKSDFLATMSHELRTPLNAILGYTDLLEMQIEGPLTEGQRTQLERIEASGRHLLMLIEDVLDLAKIEARRLGLEQRSEKVDEVTASALSLVEPQAAERKIEIVNECAGSQMAFLGDSNRLRQIALNLLSNAVKFTEPGGRVVVRCGTADAPPPESSAEGAGPWVYLEVEDTGIGIAPQEARSVFEPFMQAEVGRTRSYGGTGLGLAISRRLARLMGGDITLQTELGKGSTFRVWLTAPQPAEPPTAAPEVEEAGTAALAQIGLAFQMEQQAILNATALRMRADPEIPFARKLDDATLEDHQASFLIDAGQALVAIAEPERDPHLLRDGNDVRQLVASRHGVQRARLGWPPRAIEREYEILAEEVDTALRRCGPPVAPPAIVARAQEILNRMVKDAAQTAVAVLRDSTNR